MPTSPDGGGKPGPRGLSLSAKLVLVVIAAVAFTFVTIGLGMRAVYEDSSIREWQRGMVSLVAFASESLVRNPDPAVIERVSRDLGIDIRYTGPEGTYATLAGMPTRSEASGARRLRRLERGVPRGFSLFRFNGRPYLAHSVGQRQVIYARSDSHGHHDFHFELLLVPVAVLAALALAYGAVIWYIHSRMKPLSEMAGEMESFGADAVSSGPGGGEGLRRDEVARLSASFERMRARVGDLLESKEVLLRDVSHEIRSPLARMRLALEFVDDEKTKARMRRDIEVLDSLAGDLLDRAKLDSGSLKPKTEPVDLCRIASAAAALFEERRESIALDLPEGGVSVTGDIHLLERCVSNLLDNSMRYSRLGEGSVRVRVREEGGRGCIEVRDKGSRLESGTVDKIFEPFYRPEESRASHKGGSGLGLAIVRSIATALDGEVEAESPPEGGLAVRILLPLAGQRQEEAGA